MYSNKSIPVILEIINSEIMRAITVSATDFNYIMPVLSQVKILQDHSFKFSNWCFFVSSYYFVTCVNNTKWTPVLSGKKFSYWIINPINLKTRDLTIKLSTTRIITLWNDLGQVMEGPESVNDCTSLGVSDLGCNMYGWTKVNTHLSGQLMFSHQQLH